MENRLCETESFDGDENGNGAPVADSRLDQPESERKLGRNLQLPRIEHSARGTKQRVWSGSATIRRRIASHQTFLYGDGGGVFVMARLRAAIIDGATAVNRGDLVDVGAIEEVEGIKGQIQVLMLAKEKLARDGQIDGLEIVALVGIARREADAVGHRVGVIVDVVADKDGEGPRRLQGDNAAELEIAKEGVFRSIGGEVGNETMAHVLIGKGAFRGAIV